jgi:hypothetical protein
MRMWWPWRWSNPSKCSFLVKVADDSRVLRRLVSTSSSSSGAGDVSDGVEFASGPEDGEEVAKRARLLLDGGDDPTMSLLTVYFGTPNMFITLWFGFDYGTNPPLGTLII